MQESMRRMWRATQGPPRSTEVLLPTAVGADAHIGPPFGRDASSDLRRGRRPRRSVIDANAPTFQNMSGSGAEWQTILHLGHVLPKIPRIDRKGSQETIGFLRRSLVTLFRW